MTKVMLKVVPLCLEGVVMLVFDLTSSAPSRDNRFNIVICNQVIEAGAALSGNSQNY